MTLDQQFCAMTTPVWSVQSRCAVISANLTDKLCKMSKHCQATPEQGFSGYKRQTPLLLAIACLGITGQ
jgi:hypothetical protein